MIKNSSFLFHINAKAKTVVLLLFACVVLLGISKPLKGQEINCTVAINAEAVQTTDRRIFQDMETAFAEFINNRRWSNDDFKLDERVKCNLIINIRSMPSMGNFQAEVQVQAARPVFNTNIETILLNFADRQWNFAYTESQPLDFNDNSFTTNLTAMLAYYAYIVLAMDYDSFSPLGGQKFIDKANNVVTLAQQTDFAGWRQFDGNRNRFWLADNLMNQQFEPLREAIYDYHRQGLDIFVEKPDEARKAIVASLKKVKSVNDVSPNSILTIAFLDAKNDELVNIFSQGDMQIRREAYNILTAIDPTKMAKYRSIVQ